MGFLFWISFTDSSRVSDSDRASLLHRVHNLLGVYNFDISGWYRLSRDSLNFDDFDCNISFGTIGVFMFFVVLLLCWWLERAAV